jgi:hypothetical protein
MLREIFGTKREEVTEDWRKWHNEELYDWCFPADIVSGIDLRRMWWAGHVTGLEGKTCAWSDRWRGEPLSYPVAAAVGKRVTGFQDTAVLQLLKWANCTVPVSRRASTRACWDVAIQQMWWCS